MKNSRGAYKMLAGMIKVAGAIQDFVLKKPGTQLDSSKQKRTFSYLQDAGYIQSLDKNDNFSLTEFGKINMLYELIKKRKPDGKIRAVIFDIPEKLKTKRNVFRRHLRELGFKMRQQSVWTSNIPCEDLVKLVTKYHGLNRFTALIVGQVLQLDERPFNIR